MIKFMSIDQILKDLADGKCEIRQAKQCVFILIASMTISEICEEFKICYEAENKE